MENQIWIDLGFIGHKSRDLEKHFEKQYSLTIPTEIDLSESPKYTVFVDYLDKGQMGVKVLTNAFESQCQFNQYLVNKLIEEYVKINQPLDFQENF
jgi:hypothetical protein